MRHDFDNARRGAVLSGTGKTRVTMYLDDDVISYFRDVATQNGRGYQTEINCALRQHLAMGQAHDVEAAHVKHLFDEWIEPKAEGMLREVHEIGSTLHVLREELRAAVSTFEHVEQAISVYGPVVAPRTVRVQAGARQASGKYGSMGRRPAGDATVVKERGPAKKPKKKA